MLPLKYPIEFERCIEISKNLFCIANLDGRYNKVNLAFTTVLGYVKEELERKLFLNFIHLDDLAISIKEVEKLAKGDKMISFENRCRRKMGTP
jgi:PAS domain S-box-containing protein